MEYQQAKRTNNMLSLLQNMGRFRDGFLVLAGCLYVLGYLMWSANAWLNNLGLLPALESQYFVAGIIPLLILLLVVFGFRGERRFRKWYSDWLSPDEMGKRKWKLSLNLAINFVAVITLGFLALLMLLIIYVPVLEPILMPLFLIIVIIFSVIFPFVPRFELPSNLKTQPGRLLQAYEKVWQWYAPLFKLYQRILAGFIILYLAFFGIFLYVTVLYPNIPQEFGGVRPRCAYLDVSQDQVAKETLEHILSADALDSKRQVVQSNKVDVYFSGRDSILIKLHNKVATESTFEIKQSAILAITWCD